MIIFLLIEHSENKFIMYFENEVGPGVPQYSVQQIWILQECQTTKAKSNHFPGDSKSWESPDEVDIVWRLFIQILFR